MFQREQTTTPHPAPVYTLKPTPSSAPEGEQKAESSTSTTSPASNAETSSSELVWGPSSIETALANLGFVLKRKNSDYKVTSSEFSNFHFAADVAGIPATDVMLAQIGIKLGRLQGLRGRAEIANESIEDTVMDLAGYAVILYAYHLEMNS